MTHVTEVGDVLITCRPFVKTVATAKRSLVCEACLSGRPVWLCASCDYAYYCCESCRLEDAAHHGGECALMQQTKHLKPSSDLSRLLIRLLLKVRSGQQHSQLMPDGGVRHFEDLLSHEQEVMASQSRRLTVESLYRELKRFMPTLEVEEVVQCFGRLVINSFNVLDKDNQVMGTALYLGASVFDHSCHPSASVSFEGFEVVVKSLEVRENASLTDFHISYVDPMGSRDQRREALLTNYYFLCKCQRCQDDAEHDQMHAVMCEGCSALLLPSGNFVCKRCNDNKKMIEEIEDTNLLVQSLLMENEGSETAANLALRLMDEFNFSREHVQRFQANSILFVNNFERFVSTEDEDERRIWRLMAYKQGLQLSQVLQSYLTFPVRQLALILDKLAVLSENCDEKKLFRARAKRLLLLL